jgi:hypothetical protein
VNWAVVLFGVAAGMAVALGRAYVERSLARHYGLPAPALFRHRDVIVPFLVLATAANAYSAWIAAAYGGIAAARLSALICIALVAAAQTIQLHVALRPTRQDLELALASCAPYAYLFSLYAAALALGRYSIWLF